jgi:amino acid transporter
MAELPNDVGDTLTESGEIQRGGLARNALGLWDGLVLGFASAAPGVSIAGVLGGLALASGYGALLALLVGFLPLVCIAFGFFHLNRWRADVGISYSWVGRILSPPVGAFVGILIIIAFVVSNSFAIIPAASNFLTVFSSSAANNKTLVTIFGTIFLLAITALVVSGIRLAARFQWVITALEMTTLTIFAILALFHGLHAHSTGVKGAADPSFSWFSLHSAGGSSGLIAGLLISVFWYSGWETSVVVNEETRRSRVNPGLAGIGSLVGVLLVSLILSVMFFAAVSPSSMGNNAAWLSDLGLQLAGRPWGYFLTLAIMLGYLGGIETTIITFGNVGYSMGRDGVIWRSFGKVSQKNEMPWLAIIVLTVPCYLMFLFQVWNGGSLASILGYLSSSLGLMFVVYYALTGVASAWMLRRVARQSLWTALTGLLLPLIGAGVLVWIGIKSWAGDAQDVRTTFIVAIALSVVAVIVSRFVGKSEFYRQRVTKPVAGGDLAAVAEA